MNVPVSFLALVVGVGAGVAIDLLVMPWDPPAAVRTTGAALQGTPLRDRILQDAASRGLGEPPSGSEPGTFGAFDYVALPPQDRFDHAKALASAATLVDEALAQGIRSAARPLVVIRGFDPGLGEPPPALTSQVILPVHRAGAVSPPLVAGRLEAVRVAMVDRQPIGALPPEVLSERASVLKGAGHATAPFLAFRLADRQWRASGDTRVDVLIGVREPSR